MDDVEKRSETIDFVQFARECRRKIKAEAVDVHLQHPIAQAVHDQLQDPRVTHV